MRLGDRREDAVKVVAVRLGDGCKQHCAQCGAYPATPDDDEAVARALTPLEVDEARIRAILTREVDPANGGTAVDAEVQAVRRKLVDYCANYVTTDVNQEPLDGDAFAIFARLLKELSGGKSRAVCVSHGLRANLSGKVDEETAGRLRDIVDIMDHEDVFVLSLDLARSQGGIGYDVNVSSYVETLERLKPALEKGARVTVSIQGDDDESSPLSRGKAVDLYMGVLAKLEQPIDQGGKGWTRDLIMRLKKDSGRAWAKIGRAKNLPGVGPTGECAVIPDNSFVHNTLDIRHAIMVAVDAVSGRVFGHDNNPDKSYNDVSRWSRLISDFLRLGKEPFDWKGWWEFFVSNDPFPDLTDEFAETLARRVEARLVQIGGAARRANTLPGVGPALAPLGDEISPGVAGEAAGVDGDEDGDTPD